LVAVEDLMQSSLDVEVERHMEELELGVSETLGISLLEVQAQYFQDSDLSERRDQDLDSELCNMSNMKGVNQGPSASKPLLSKKRKGGMTLS
jgi:hypothetical protein